jgi:Zn-dependent protease with chaperone function
MVLSALAGPVILGFADSVNFFTSTAAATATTATSAATNTGMAPGLLQAAQSALPSLPISPIFLILGIALIAVTIFLLFFLKKIVMNSVLGAVIWFVSVFVFGVKLPLLPSFVISIIFGPAGIGTMLVLAVFGLLAV